MTELIIIKTNNSQDVRKLLEEKHISYEVYQTPKKNFNEEENFRQKLISGYKSVATNKERQKEANIWDETLNDAWRKSSKTKKSPKIKNHE